MEFLYALNQDLIFIPVAIMVGITFFAYLNLAKTRIALHKAKAVNSDVYKLNIGEHEKSHQLSNALANQFEAPVLFYAVCLSAYVTQTASLITIILAFAYVIARILHYKSHAGENVIATRFKMFIWSMRALMILWVSFLIQLTIKNFY